MSKPKKVWKKPELVVSLRAWVDKSEPSGETNKGSSNLTAPPKPQGKPADLAGQLNR